MRKAKFDPECTNIKELLDFCNVDLLSKIPIKKGHGNYFLVKCRDCGKEYYKAGFTFSINKCQCYKTLNGAYNYQGYKAISSVYYKSCKANAKVKNREFSISKEDMWEQWLMQEGKCKLSGVSIHIERNYKKMINMTASLDRIDSTKGYTRDNIQWIHKYINRMKSNFTEEYFIKMCKLISKNN